MSGYVLGIDAAQDLEEIWEFIAVDKVDAANRWIGKLSMRLKHWRELPAWAIGVET